MKKGILTLAVLASFSSMAVIAEEAKTDGPDMADPTAVYAYAGLAYGNKGLDFEAMAVLTKTDTQRSGFIFEVKDILDEDNYTEPTTGRDISSRNFRLRYGNINTTNGLGGFADIVAAEHPFFGNMVVAQAGPVATIPIGDDIYIWPMLLVGGVVAEDNTSQNLEFAIAKTKAGIVQAEASGNTQAANSLKRALAGLMGQQALTTTSSEGMDWMTTTGTAMSYIRYQPHEDFFALGSIRYTKALAGKEWDKDIIDGGLQMASTAWDLKLGYYLTKTQTITLYYSGDNTSADDKYSLGYKFAF
ncbi:Putative uncharacterized protein [Moritella viscosa]|uniref:hypothetical protein n=1 Tax=Moritella viscosa TaxID=80854 RepID=UPI00050901DE|nr:hypothetical protein [Moritella viscosa]CED59035.1 putative exported protein [Moritella viscosa]SHN99098.1 Putative uncharacterized protein [Moritella viscosa]SHO20030.1 Putative uncharacterized protein [Moritella viscosa]